jgi:hypothetical protein
MGNDIYSEDNLRIYLPLNEMYCEDIYNPLVTIRKSMYIFELQTNILDETLEKSSRFNI